MKTRLIAGTINFWPSDDEWQNTHLDISDRGIYDANDGRARFVSPEIVANLADGLPMIVDASFDEVRLHHVLEHLSLEANKAALTAVYRVLKPGGWADIEVPDMEAICHAWVEGVYSPDQLQQWIYGEQLKNHEPGDSHRYGFWEDRLLEILGGIGFVVTERLDPGGLALRVIARKP